MPNTLPAMDNAGLLSDLQARARVQGLVRVRQVGAISRGLAGEALSDFEALAQAGAVAFSDDGRPVENGELMRLALERAAALGKPVLSHAEELTLPSGLAASESAPWRATSAWRSRRAAPCTSATSRPPPRCA